MASLEFTQISYFPVFSLIHIRAKSAEHSLISWVRQKVVRNGVNFMKSTEREAKARSESRPAPEMRAIHVTYGMCYAKSRYWTISETIDRKQNRMTSNRLEKRSEVPFTQWSSFWLLVIGFAETTNYWIAFNLITLHIIDNVLCL